MLNTSIITEQNQEIIYSTDFSILQHYKTLFNIQVSKLLYKFNCFFFLSFKQSVQKLILCMQTFHCWSCTSLTYKKPQMLWFFLSQSTHNAAALMYNLNKMFSKNSNSKTCLRISQTSKLKTFIHLCWCMCCLFVDRNPPKKRYWTYKNIFFQWGWSSVSLTYFWFT